MIYLDYSANTPADPAVLEVFVRTENSFGGNPNSSHPAGLAAKEKLEQTTGSIADLLEIQASEVVYTSGASEANNLAVNCSYRHQDRVVPEKLPEVICVYLSIPSDVRKIDLIPLLLQPGKRSADRRMLQSC